MQAANDLTGKAPGQVARVMGGRRAAPPAVDAGPAQGGPAPASKMSHDAGAGRGGGGGGGGGGGQSGKPHDNTDAGHVGHADAGAPASKSTAGATARAGMTGGAGMTGAGGKGGAGAGGQTAGGSGADLAIYEGNWSGMTSQGKPISFTVLKDMVTNMKYTVKLTGDVCQVSDITTELKLTTTQIVDASFMVNSNGAGLTHRISGHFTSESSAEGDFNTDLRSTSPGAPSCHAKGSGTWSAEKE